MIKNVKVSGFKTLSNFYMDVKPGLNILVGPNGSGKTNIISFFEFLGLIQSMNISDAVSSAGGAGSIFRKTGEETFESDINAEIVGSLKIGSRKYLYYKYSFNIHIPESSESVIYSSQKLIVKVRSTDSIDEKRLRNFDLVIEKIIDNNLKPTINVDALKK